MARHDPLADMNKKMQSQRDLNLIQQAQLHQRNDLSRLSKRGLAPAEERMYLEINQYRKLASESIAGTQEIDGVMMIPVISSNVQAVGYNDLEKKMYVTFLSGASYVYYDVSPYKFKTMLNAGSKGKFLHWSIKGRNGFSKL